MSEADDFYVILNDEEWQELFSQHGSKIAILRIAEAAIAFARGHGNNGTPREILLGKRNKWVVAVWKDSVGLYWNGTGWSPHRSKALVIPDEDATGSLILAQKDFPSAFLTSSSERVSPKSERDDASELASRAQSACHSEGISTTPDLFQRLRELFVLALRQGEFRQSEKTPPVFVLKREGKYNYVGSCGYDYFSPDLEKAVLLTEKQAKERLCRDSFQGCTMVPYYDELNRNKT